MRRKQQRDESGTGTITLCLCEVPKTADRAGREERKKRSTSASFMQRRVEGMDAPAHCRCGRGGHCPRTTRDGLLACRALPDPDRLTFHSVLEEQNERTTSANPYPW